MESSGLSRRHHGGALLLYLYASALFFGRGLITHPQSYYIGTGPDPSQFIWYMVWWPWAILHHVNPIYTNMVWSPTGFNLMWSTSIPGPSIALAPVTYFFGPIVSYNLLMLSGPALTAWAGYLLCHHLTRAWLPSMAGGYVLGFTAYEFGHMVGHPNLLLFFVPPLLVLFSLRMIEGNLGARAFVAIFTSLLVLQFLISTEVFATTAIFGAIALILAMAVWRDGIGKILSLCGMIAVSGATAALILSPLLYWVFVSDAPRAAIYPPAMFSGDLLGPIVPGAMTLLAPSFLLGLTAHFTVPFFDNGTYIGIPLIAVIVTYLVRPTGSIGKLSSAFLLIVFVLSLGPVLQIAGRPIIPMPWALVSHLPLLEHVLPVRLMSYAYLAVGIAFALWLADPSIGVMVRGAVAAICLVSILPRSIFSVPSKASLPPFFADGLYRQYLPPGATILPVPYRASGECMQWQAQSEMYFKMAGGYLNLVPADFRRWPIVNTLSSGIEVADPANQLKAFLAAKHVDAIVVADRDPEWSRLLSSIGVESHEVGGVAFYDLRGMTLADPEPNQIVMLEASADAAWFGGLVDAAAKYLAQGRPLAEVRPTTLNELGLLPHAVPWKDDLDAVLAGWRLGLGTGQWLGPAADGGIAVGISGSPQAIAPIIQRYGSDATTIQYPYPRKYSAEYPLNQSETYFLLMSMAPDRLKALTR